ncbi:MAG TPA: hypothetical protein PKA99_15145, partial [Dermatophilaceae bacterium]|nr:hypothetical protein [Dermatophilaceae bacterium]
MSAPLAPQPASGDWRPATGMPSRRLLLRVTTSGALALGVVALGGCRIQLEQDAQIPFITRTLMPDESALLTAYRQVSELAALAARTNSPDAAVIAARHTRQRAVLEQLLRDGGVPDDVMTRALGVAASTSGTAATPGATGVAVGSTAASTSAGTTSAGPMRPDDLATAELALVAPERVRALADVGPARGILAAITVHGAATGIRLGGTASWPADPTTPVLDQGTATSVLTALAGLGYVIDLAAARTAGDSRSTLVALAARVRDRERRLKAVSPAGLAVSPYGFRSPAAVTDATTGHAAVQTALADLIDATLNPVAGLPVGSPALPPLLRAAVESLVDATAYGQSMPTFP